jgi:hypothetical protein
MVMETKMKKRGSQALLQSRSDDGTQWLYTILHGAGWEITRNGERVARGPTGARSIQVGVDRFMALTSSQPDVEVEPLSERTFMAMSA